MKRMIYLNSRAEDDLVSILLGLLTWKKHFIELEHAKSYINDIRKECLSLATKNHHFNATFANHKRFGKKVHTYNRNKNTQWYIIYNIDIHGNIFINHITSNHTTISETK